MSDITNVEQTGNSLITNYDVSKIFLLNNRYVQREFTNGGGAPVTLTPGRVMGLIFATNKVAVQDTAATNGSQVPFGILKTGKTVAAGATVTLNVCIGGDIAAEKVSYASGQTAASTVSLTDSAANTVVIGTIDSILLGKGIILKAGTEMTRLDNQP